MSSTVQSSPVTKTPPATATHALAMMKAIAPHIDQLAACLSEGTTSRDQFSVNDQLIRMQQALAEAKLSVEKSVAPEILAKGGDYDFFLSINQRPQGSWIRDTYLLITELGERIRSNLYSPGADTLQIRDAILTTDSSTDASLPRLMRAVTKSYFYTELYLGVPSHRAYHGITFDFGSSPFNRFLANSSNAV